MRPQILFLHDNQWQPLPEWAEFFIELGKFVAAQSKITERTVIGVTLPTRAFAAAFVATGTVIGQSVENNTQSADEYFNFLWNQPEGTMVTYLDKSRKGKTVRKIKGILQHCEESNGEKKLRVQTTKSTMRDQCARAISFLVTSQLSKRIQLLEAEESFGAQDLPIRQTGALVVQMNRFAQCVAGKVNNEQFSDNSTLSCLIVGKRNQLQEEITKEEFEASNDNTEYHNGNLGDVLQPRTFMSLGKTFRSDIVSTNARHISSIMLQTLPSVIVFDGAKGFIKWRDRWSSSHWVVLLDQTETGFNDAVHVLNQDYLLKRIFDKPIPGGLPMPPDGVEIVYYQEKIQWLIHPSKLPRIYTNFKS